MAVGARERTAGAQLAEPGARGGARGAAGEVEQRRGEARGTKGSCWAYTKPFLVKGHHPFPQELLEENESLRKESKRKEASHRASYEVHGKLRQQQARDLRMRGVGVGKRAPKARLAL